jgi:hypothetical protein
MDKKHIQSILKEALEQEYPPSQIDLLPNVQERLVPGRNRSTGQGEKMNRSISRRLSRFALGTLAILALLATAFITPQGRAFAQDLLQFFRRAESNVLPLPVEQVAATDDPSAPTAPPPAPLVSVAEAEKTAGFDARELPSVPSGFRFAGAMANAGGISIQYDAQGGGGALLINESVHGFMQSEWDRAPAESISSAKVGGLEAEFVQGAYVVYPNATNAEWNRDAAALRLRWIEDGIWFEMAKFGDVESITYLDQAEMIALAGSMVYTPVESQDAASTPAGLTDAAQSTTESDHVLLAELAEARKVAAFDVQELPSTPQGMVFQGATATSGSITLQYASEEQGAGTLSINESLTGENWEEFPTEAMTEIHVGEVDAELIKGAYIFRPGDASGTWNADVNIMHLRWSQNGVWFEILLTGGGVGSLAHLDQDGLIALAESMMEGPFSLEIAEAEALAGFDVLKPTWVPEALSFKGAAFESKEWQRKQNTVRTFYFFSSDEYGPGLESNGVILTQQPIESVEDCEICDLIGPTAEVQTVQIGGSTGEYVLGVWKADDSGNWIWEDEPYLQRLRWQANGVAFELLYMGPPEAVTKADLVAIAESLK